MQLEASLLFFTYFNEIILVQLKIRSLLNSSLAAKFADFYEHQVRTCQICYVVFQMVNCPKFCLELNSQYYPYVKKGLITVPNCFNFNSLFITSKSRMFVLREKIPLNFSDIHAKQHV